jgi:hypothetical protein
VTQLRENGLPVYQFTSYRIWRQNMACLPHKLNLFRNVVYFLFLFSQKTYCNRKKNMFTELQVLGALYWRYSPMWVFASSVVSYSKSCRGGVVSTASNTQTRGPETTVRLASTLCLSGMGSTTRSLRSR